MIQVDEHIFQMGLVHPPRRARLQICTGKEPWRLTWNAHNSLEVWFRSCSFLNGWFVVSMLTFRGLHFFTWNMYASRTLLAWYQVRRNNCIRWFPCDLIFPPPHSSRFPKYKTIVFMVTHGEVNKKQWSKRCLVALHLGDDAAPLINYCI